MTLTSKGVPSDSKERDYCGVLILRLPPIIILLIQPRNSFILAPPLSPKILSTWKSGAESTLPEGTVEKALSSTGMPKSGVGVQEAEAPGRMCCGRLKPLNRVVNGQLR